MNAQGDFITECPCCGKVLNISRLRLMKSVTQNYDYNHEASTLLLTSGESTFAFDMSCPDCEEDLRIFVDVDVVSRKVYS